MKYTRRYLYSREFLEKNGFLPVEEVKKILNVIGISNPARGVEGKLVFDKDNKIIYFKVDATKFTDAFALRTYKEWRRDTKYLLGL